MELHETVYEHETGSDTFTVTASEPWSVAMIKRLNARFPDQVQIIHTNKDGSMLVHLPFEWMRIIPKKKVAITDEQRAILSARMQTINSKL